MKEHGVNSTNQTSDKPKVAPPSPSVIKYAKLPSTFRNRVTL